METVQWTVSAANGQSPGKGVLETVWLGLSLGLRLGQVQAYERTNDIRALWKYGF